MNRPRIEHAFLPASLELQATPPSPIGRWLLWSLLFLLLVALAWSCWARIDIVAIAGGKAVPGGQVKVIQAFEPGVVKAIHVRDGDKVDRDDLLIELDETEAVARMRQVEDELDTVRSQQARLERLRQYIKPDSETGTDHTDPSDASERALLNREREQHAAQLAQLTGQRLRHEEELGTVEARIAGLRGIHDLVAQRGKALEKLSTVGHVSTEAWLKVAQEQRGIETELAVLDRQHRSIGTAIDNIGRDRAAYLAERLRAISDARLTAKRREAALEQELATSRLRLSRHRLMAPVAGRIQQLATHTVGGVVTPAQEILRIVPADDELEIEAQVLNRDSGEVRTGMPAVVKLQAYPFTRYGTLAAKVVALSADALNDPNHGLVYKARVRLLSIDSSAGHRLRLEPGMAATVEIRIGERRVIELLLNPLVRALQEAGRER